MIYAIERIGYGPRTRYTVKAVTEMGTNPTNGKAYRTEDAAHLAAPHRYEPFTELFDVAQLDAIVYETYRAARNAQKGAKK